MSLRDDALFKSEGERVMMMEDYFRQAIEGLKSAAEHLTAASREISLSSAALVEVSDAVLRAHDERQSDLRAILERVEALLTTQATDIRTLRDRLMPPT